MGKFVDLHILPPVDDRQSCGQMAELLRTVHYSDVALTLPTGLLRDRVKSVRQAFEQHNLKAYLRADLSPPSRTELLRVLRNFRATFDIIAVRCLNQRVATVACRDRRVDIIFFDLTNRNMRFTHSHARVLRGALELNFADLISQPESWAFSRVRKTIAVAEEHHVGVVLSSGARGCQMIRSPIELSGLATALGMKQEESIRGVSSRPATIVATNLRKRAPGYIEEGVKIVVPSR